MNMCLFLDPSKVIERAAFDASMIEFNFWFGVDKFKRPAFFALPYPFANIDSKCTHHFPEDSYYDESFKDCFEWENCEYSHKPLSIEENKAVKNLTE